VHRVDLQACPEAAVAPLATHLARLQVASFAELSALLRRRGVWPIELSAERAGEVLAILRARGCAASSVEVPASAARCPAHPSLVPDRACAHCHRGTCALCLDAAGLCAGCGARRDGARRRQQLRLVPLLLVLGVVLLGALGVVKQRVRRRSWDRPLRVTVVLASPAPVSERVRSAWRVGVDEVDRWFAAEAARYGLAAARPVEVQLADEVLSEAPPRTPVATGALLEDTQRALAFRASLERLAPRTGADLTLLIALREHPPGSTGLVEGATERFGAVGLVEGSAAESEVSLELIAAAHEVLHAVGAEDAYDAEGRPVSPGGLADPELVEQTHAEIMAGAFPPGADHEVPRSLEEVRIGAVTARAIGWLR
jgi:hypothetical protein